MHVWCMAAPVFLAATIIYHVFLFNMWSNLMKQSQKSYVRTPSHQFHALQEKLWGTPAY